MHWAVWGNYSLTVDLLIAAPQVDIDIQVRGSKHGYGGNSPLINAAGRGNNETATKSIEAGANLNIVNEKGNTALHSAAKQGHVDIVTTLITAGADLNLFNGAGHTVLPVAVLAGRVAVVEALMSTAMPHPARSTYLGHRMRMTHYHLPATLAYNRLVYILR